MNNNVALTDRLLGVEVIVVRPPAPKIVRRTWRERFLSRPWRPWRSAKTVTFASAIAHDQCIQIGNTLYFGETYYARLKEWCAKRAIAKSEKSDSSHDAYWTELKVKRLVQA